MRLPKIGERVFYKSIDFINKECYNKNTTKVVLDESIAFVYNTNNNFFQKTVKFENLYVLYISTNTRRFVKNDWRNNW